MPMEVLELTLMERFNWTPSQIDEIPEQKLRTILMIMNMRHEISERAVQAEAELAKKKVKEKKR
jgi:hypothetical protein